MPTVNLRRSGLATSRLGLGTAHLHHLDAISRRRLIDTALDLGITHIDTAPSYGDTQAERIVGDVLTGRRSRVVLATKFGIDPSPVIAAMPAVATPWRGGRALLRKIGIGRPSRRVIEPGRLVASVEASLRRLRTSWIDILFLHEPGIDTVRDPAEIQSCLDGLKQSGKIRHYGLAGDWQRLLTLGAARQALGVVVQTGESEWSGNEPPDVTYGAIAGEPQSFTRGPVPPATAQARILAALARRPSGTVVVATRHPAKLHGLVEAAGRA